MPWKHLIVRAFLSWSSLAVCLGLEASVVSLRGLKRRKTMSKQYSETIGDLARLTAALGANATELPHLEGVRGRLEKILADA